MRFMSTIAGASIASAIFVSTSLAQQKAADFAPAKELQAGKAKFTGILYPSPKMHDLDGDGVRELVVGDLPGLVRYSKKLDGGALAWSKLLNVKQGDKPLKLFNW